MKLGPRRGRTAWIGLVWALSLLGTPAICLAGGPDRTLYEQAKKARGALEGSAKKQARDAEWERVVLAYRRVVARYPRSPYCDNALLAAGDLYRQMATRFATPRYYEDAVKAYRMVVSEYPSSSLGEQALFAAFDISRQTGGEKQIKDAGRRYLKTYPNAKRSQQVRALMKKGAVPKPPQPGLAQIFNLRFWTGESSTRVVLDLERQVKTKYDRIGNPERLWIDLLGTRLHPNLSDRTFPVGDGLLERVRIGPNREGVVRVVLDFKDVKDHTLFYLQDPARLVVDVKGTPTTRTAGNANPAAGTSSARSQPATAASGRVARGPETGVAPKPPTANRKGDRSLARQLGLGARRIVIDPGHGGHDPGAIGRGGLQEKDLVLDVALRLANVLRKKLGAEVILTRSTDVFIPLEERTAIANSRGADLFLSIHANSSRSRSARGVETYYLNFATDPHAEAVAARENAISEATLKDLQSLVKAITLNSKIDESRDFAASVHESLAPRNSRLDRGVRTAPFYVLIGANMPSVLAEIAFISNPTDEKQLRGKSQRDKVAHSLAVGVQRYLQALSPTQTQQLTRKAQGSRVNSSSGTRR